MEEKLEWLRDYNGNITISNLLNSGMDLDELFEIDNYDDFITYIAENSGLVQN